MTNTDRNIDIQVTKERELKAKLAINGFTQREVAELVGVHPAMICRVINGTRSSKRVLAFIEHLPLTVMRGA
jgi:predicted transcriptional regulator